MSNQPPEEQSGTQNPPKSLIQELGPGLITGAADDDPSGIGTYAIAGAAHGYSLLWLAPFCLPLMVAVQLTCARVGLVSGMGLAGVVRRHFPRWVLYASLALLIVANTLNAGADIGAIAEATNLILPIPTYLLYLPIAGIILAMQVFGSYALMARIFKWTTLSLLAYVGAGLLASPDWIKVLRGALIPHLTLNVAFLTTFVAIIGTTISPYLFFWQTNQEFEEEIAMGRNLLSQRQGASKKEIHAAALDTEAGMLAAIVVMFFIMLATAATLNAEGQTQIESAADAARALEPLAGSASKYLLAIGLIGTGFLAVPILTGSTAYAVAEGLKFNKWGFDEKPRQAGGFYGIIIISTLVGLMIDFAGINAITALFVAAVVNGMLAPPLLVLILIVANDRDVMGDWTNTRRLNLGAVLCTLVMAGASGALVLLYLFG